MARGSEKGESTVSEAQKDQAAAREKHAGVREVLSLHRVTLG